MALIEEKKKKRKSRDLAGEVAEESHKKSKKKSSVDENAEKKKQSFVIDVVPDRVKKKKKKKDVDSSSDDEEKIVSPKKSDPHSAEQNAIMNAYLKRIAPKTDDWACADCGQSNFGSRSNCRRCHTDKPEILKMKRIKREQSQLKSSKFRSKRPRRPMKAILMWIADMKEKKKMKKPMKIWKKIWRKDIDAHIKMEYKEKAAKAWEAATKNTACEKMSDVTSTEVSGEKTPLREAAFGATLGSKDVASDGVASGDTEFIPGKDQHQPHEKHKSGYSSSSDSDFEPPEDMIVQCSYVNFAKRTECNDCKEKKTVANGLGEKSSRHKPEAKTLPLNSTEAPIYKCCNKAYSSRRMVNSHKRKRHFSCTICSNHYKSPYNLNSHMKKKHLSQPISLQSEGKRKADGDFTGEAKRANFQRYNLQLLRLHQLT